MTLLSIILGFVALVIFLMTMEKIPTWAYVVGLLTFVCYCIGRGIIGVL
jgi:hypothetical protein